MERDWYGERSGYEQGTGVVDCAIAQTVGTGLEMRDVLMLDIPRKDERKERAMSICRLAGGGCCRCCRRKSRSDLGQLIGGQWSERQR